jgi:hypothetical protein
MVEDWPELVGDESGSRDLDKTALVLADDADAMDCRCSSLTSASSCILSLDRLLRKSG